MQKDPFQTPTRQKYLTSPSSDLKTKHSTLQSRLTRQIPIQRECEHWSKHEKVRQSRINSLFKLRKHKLQAITGQNRKIFVKINQQQSYYPSYASPQHSDQKSIKSCQQDKMLGPIANWQPPVHFISGNRGIMCEKNIMESTITRNDRKKLPSLPRLKTPQKQNKIDFFTPQSLKHQTIPLRRKEISDLYMIM